jgi:hypothetical protein
MTLLSYAEERGLVLDRLVFWEDYPGIDTLELTFAVITAGAYGIEKLTKTLYGDDRRAMLTYLQTHAVPLY